jgi:CRP-like cAMP-binding protein
MYTRTTYLIERVPRCGVAQHAVHEGFADEDEVLFVRGDVGDLWMVVCSGCVVGVVWVECVLVM